MIGLSNNCFGVLHCLYPKILDFCLLFNFWFFYISSDNLDWDCFFFYELESILLFDLISLFLYSFCKSSNLDIDIFLLYNFSVFKGIISLRLNFISCFDLLLVILNYFETLSSLLCLDKDLTTVFFFIPYFFTFSIGFSIFKLAF
jgi:hypothetical protein